LPPQKPLVITGHLGRDGIYVPSTDVWDVECGSRTDSIRASLKDQTPGTMEAFINKDGDTARITDNNVAVDFKHGQGHYQLNVSNLSGVKGNLFYSVYLNCLDAKLKNTEIQAELKHHKDTDDQKKK
jgi:hypothetical protein